MSTQSGDSEVANSGTGAIQPLTAKWPFRRLPLRMFYRSLELSAETLEMLDEAMVRLSVDDPDEAAKTAFRCVFERNGT